MPPPHTHPPPFPPPCFTVFAFSLSVQFFRCVLLIFSILLRVSGSPGIFVVFVLVGALFAFRHAFSPVVGLSHAARLAGRGQSHQWVLRGPVPDRQVGLVVLLVEPHAA